MAVDHLLVIRSLIMTIMIIMAIKPTRELSATRMVSQSARTDRFQLISFFLDRRIRLAHHL